MTTFLATWLITQTIAVLLIWYFALGVGRAANPAGTPSVVVIVAVKGNHHEFGHFLDHLFAQTYPDYRVVFAVESADDTAIGPIEARRAAAPDRVDLVIAGLSDDEGQKVANLRAALHAIRASDAIVVFADSDIRPDADWLAHLVDPLTRNEADLVSGFAWIVAKDGSPWSLIEISMAATMVTVPRLPVFNACWGGSIAMRRERCEALKLDEIWRGALSDDLQLTAEVQRQGLRVAAPPEVLPRLYVAIPRFSDISVDALRWLMLFRVYTPGTFALTLLGLTFAAAGWLGAVAAAAAGQPLLLGLAFALTLLRTAGRGLVVAQVWGRVGLVENRAFLLCDPITTPIAAVLNAAFAWCALFKRRAEWAGTVYEISGPQRTKVLSRRPPA